MLAQFSDDVENKAKTFGKEAPKQTKEMRKAAEEQAQKVADQARPTADEASKNIEGAARDFAKGVAFFCAFKHIQGLVPCLLFADRCIALPVVCVY